MVWSFFDNITSSFEANLLTYVIFNLGTNSAYLFRKHGKQRVNEIAAVIKIKLFTYLSCDCPPNNLHQKARESEGEMAPSPAEVKMTAAQFHTFSSFLTITLRILSIFDHLVVNGQQNQRNPFRICLHGWARTGSLRAGSQEMTLNWGQRSSGVVQVRLDCFTELFGIWYWHTGTDFIEGGRVVGGLPGTHGLKSLWAPKKGGQNSMCCRRAKK